MITVIELCEELFKRIVYIEYIDVENKIVHIKATLNPELDMVQIKDVEANILGNKIQVWDIDLKNWRLIDISRVKSFF